MQYKKELRREIRTKRGALGEEQQERAALELVTRLRKESFYQNANKVACYIHRDGELGTQYLIDDIWQSNKTCYLPKITSAEKSEMLFIEYPDDMDLIPNRYGIDEPPGEKGIEANELSLVLLPLVAFDNIGNRLGMGGGYYDRFFAFKQSSSTLAEPLLIGIAHDCQQVKHIDTESWDIPLSAIVTPSQVHHFD